MMELPPNFQVGQANRDGDCFFDSVAQGLKQLKPELDFTVKSLRLVCKSFAQSQLDDEQSWLKEALKEENEKINEYIAGIEFSTNDFNQKCEKAIVLGLTSPIWGISDIEGRIICAEYDVTLHVAERHIVEELELWTHQTVDIKGSRFSDIFYYKNDKSTLHVVNTGDLHYDPILRIEAVQHNKELSPNPCDDSDEEDVEVTTKNELFYAVWSNYSEAEKITKMTKIFERAPKLDINFQGIDKDTCLHIAVRKKELKVIEFLLEKGARTDIKNNKDRSPLDDAGRLKRLDIVQIIEPCVPQIIVKPNQASGHQINQTSEHEKSVLRLTDGDSPTDKDLKLQKNDLTTVREFNTSFYEKRPGTDGIHGHLYEIELSMLLLLQAEAKERDKKINSFHLATNMQGVGDFDDIVFKYKYSENGVEKSDIIFFQAKHKEAEKGKIVTMDTLLSLSNKGDFILRKYLRSYTKIRQLKVKEDHPLSLEITDGRSNFVIFTNAASKFEEKLTDLVKKEDALLYPENSKKYYYELNANEKVKYVLRQSLDFEILVRELAQSVYSGSIESSKPIFKDYHVALAHRVIQVSEANKEESRLREDFLDGTKDAEFSCAFLEEIRKNKNFFIAFSAESDHELKKELKNKIIKLPKNFGHAQLNNLNLPLPGKTIPDKTIEQFLKEFKLYVNQPNVIGIEGTIKKMIISLFMIEEKDDADLIYSYVHKKVNEWWTKQGNVKYFTEHDKLFTNAKENLSVMKLVGLAIFYAQPIKSLGLNFNSCQIARLSNLVREKRILRIISDKDAILLSTVKVYQALEGMDEYKSEGDNYKYIFVGLTSALELQTNVIDAFRSERRDLLVIESEETNVNCRQLCKQLADTIKCSDRKKLVLISGGNDTFAEKIKSYFSEGSQYQEEIDRNNTLADLDSKSRATIGKKQVIFQGKKIKLGTLVDEKSKHLVVANVLSKLIKNEKIKVDKILGDLEKVGDYYINRKFYRRVNIKQECFEEKKINDVFVVSNVKHNEFSLLINGEKVCKFTDTDLDRENTVRFLTLDDDENVRETLKQLYAKRPTSTIHWVKKQGYKYIWKESLGSLSNLREFVDTEDIREYPADKITSVEDRIVIVSAEPGMGKSVLLTKLAEKEKDTDPSLWVVRLNLNDYTKQLKKMNFAEINLKGTINFLSKIMDLKTPLEKKLFKHRVEHQGKIVFLFDGFDEISPDYKEKVIALVTVLKETKVDKLWITTRPHMRNELEDKFSVLSHSLKPLTTKDQKYFLKKFWGRKLNLKDDNDDKRLNTYIEELLKVWSLSIGDEERNFTGIPLQTRMLAEVYQDKFKEFFNSDQTIPNFSSKLNLVDLYQSFVNKKYKIYWSEKNKADTTMPRVKKQYKDNRPNFILQHQLLALEMLFSNEEISSLLSADEQILLKGVKKDVFNGRENSGIISLNIYGTLNFIHRTFAEYFAALWLANSINRREVKNHLHSKLFETENRVLRNFFDRILSSNKNSTDTYKIHSAVLNNDIKKVEELCLGSPNYEVDNGGRTALHLAAAYGFSEIAKILLKYDPQRIHTKDTMFGWRPLRYADNGSHWHVADLLLQEGGIGEDMDLAISNINFRYNNEKTLLHIAAEEGLSSFAKFLINKNANIHAKAYYYTKTPLQIAAQHGHLNVLQVLIDNRDKLDLKTELSGKTVLSAAVKGYWNVVIFLAKQGANLSRRNYEGNTVLHIAAKSDKWDVVQVLIEQGADMTCQNYDGNTALHYAVKADNWDIVKVLIEQGADLKCRNNLVDIILHLVAEKSNLDVVMFLIEKGADLNFQNGVGNTALHNAVEEGNWNVVKFLIEKGADLNCQNQSGDTILHFAAKKSNLDVVKFFTEKGADLNCKNKVGNTALHNAVEEDNWNVVSFLIEKGADLNSQNQSGDTILHFAVEQNNWDAVKFLIEKGADMNCKNKYGDTVLLSLAKKGNWDLVEFLIDKEADLNCQNHSGDTILHFAAEKGNLKVVKLLTKKGADLNLQNKARNTALYYAAEKVNWDVVEFLTERGADMNCKYGYTVLHFAAEKNYWDVVMSLTEKGADLNCKNQYGYTILHIAAEKGNLKVVKFLTKKGANLNCTNMYGDTILHSAAKKVNWDVVEFLIEKGADLNCQNHSGDTILHFAAEKGNLKVVKFLTKKEANLNCRNQLGDTILHSAARGGYFHLVEFLIEKGANLNCKNKLSDTILHFAAEKGNLDVVKGLIKKGADVHCQKSNGDTVLHCAARNGNLDLVKLLIEEGADVHCHNKIGDIALHSAAKKGNFDTVKFLIEKGADVNCKNKLSDTTLHFAAEKGNLDVVRLLVEKGADVNCKDRNGETFLHYAASWGNLNLVKLLIEKGADIHCRNEKGDTILHYAAKKGYLDVVKFLIEKGADFNCPNSGGDIVLQDCAKARCWGVVKLLLEKGAYSNCPSETSITILHEDACNNHFIYNLGNECNNA